MNKLLLTGLIALSLPLAAVGQNAPAAPESPDAERATFKLLDGFEVNLFAAEPMVRKPIAMTWDARGRLLVACSTSYPQIKPGEKANDQIIALEDTNGDGVADKSTVFADGLYVPTGLETGDGGVYVANAPDLLFFKDTDGDGKADVRRVLLSGFGTEDNHHSIHAWRWDPAGWLYFQEGTFHHSQVETPFGLVRLENGGIFQLRPRTQDLRVFSDYRASNNWGHYLTRYGQSIVLDNVRFTAHSANTANSRAKLDQPTIFTANTKYCGGEIMDTTHLPPQFRDEIWACGYKVHAIGRFKVLEDSSGFSIREEPPLLTSTSENFRPVDVKIGPDGAIYVADWYNPLIGHMQHEFRDPRRDKLHGRIWRITRKNAPLLQRPAFEKMSTLEVMQQLKSPESWVRYQAHRVLHDTPAPQVREAAAQFLASLDSADPLHDTHRLEALWTLQSVDVIDAGLLKTVVLDSRDGRVRAAGFRALRYWHPHIPEALALLERGIADEHPQARLESILTLSYIPRPEAMKIALRALDRPTDQWIEHALKLCVDALEPQWLSAMQSGGLTFDSDKHQAYALSNVRSDRAVRPLLDMLNSGSVEPAQLESVLATLTRTATSNQLDPLLDRFAGVTSGGLPPATEARIISALEAAARSRGAVPPRGPAVMKKYITAEHADVRLAMVRLAGAWRMKDKATVANLQKHVQNERETPEIRAAAARALGEIGETTFLTNLTADTKPIALRYLAVIGLSVSDINAAAPRAAAALAAPPGDADPTPMVAAFIARAEGGQRLAEAMGDHAVHPEAAAKIIAHLNATGLQQPALTAALRRAMPPGGGTPLDQQLLAEDPPKLYAEIESRGDAGRGEQIFRRPQLACVSCHAIAGGGPELGPDLASIGSSAPIDYVVEAILQPNKTIKDQYENVVIIGKDGRVVSGILVFKNDEQIVVRDASRSGQETGVRRSEVAQLVAAPSLMPAGLVNLLGSRQEFLDLAKFISQLGKPGEYATPTLPLIRRWRIIAGDDELARQRDDAAWRPAYSMTSGALPTDAFAGHATVLARGHISVTTAGTIRVEVNALTGVKSIWLGEQRVEAGRDIDIAAGLQPLTFVIDTAARGNVPLKVQIHEGAGRPARYQVVTGP